MSTMVRLSSSIKSEIIKKVMAHKFAKERIELEELREKQNKATEEYHKLSYETAFNEAQRKILKQYEPQKWFPYAGHVNIRIEHGPDNYEDVNALFGENMPVPFKHQFGHGTAAVVDKDHPFAKAVEAAKLASNDYDVAFRALREQERGLHAKVSTVLDSVTTVKRVREVWPEIADFLPEEVSGAGGGVPAYMIADLNKELGIEKEE